MSEFQCVNCAGGQPMEKPPIPNAYGRDIQTRVCRDCYARWKDLEVMVINEYRLNLLEQDDRRRLREQMEHFLNLDGNRKPGENVEMKPSGYVDPNAR